MAHLLLTWPTLFQKLALLLRKTAGPWMLKLVSYLMFALKYHIFMVKTLSLTFALFVCALQVSLEAALTPVMRTWAELLL